MGITAVLETEEGEALDIVEDPTNVLHRILPSAGDPSYQHLNRIDWYGDTVFNQLQAPQLLEEWQRLDRRERDSETERVASGIRRLAERLGTEHHVYLKFYGD